MPGDRLRIAICLLYYVPHRTGLTIYVQRVAEALAQRGHEVTVLTARYSNLLPRDEIAGVRVIRLLAPLKVSRGMVMPAYPWAFYALARQSDVISVHTPMLETALIAAEAKLAGKPVVVTHHGDLILPDGLVNRFIKTTMFELYKPLARYASRVVAYSHDYADHSYYAKPFRDKVSVIYPPVQMPAPNPERAARLRAIWGQNGGPIIGYAGRFVEEKRPDVLIRALATINQTYPDARIVFAGEYAIKYEDTWEMHYELTRQYSDQLVFLGLHDEMQFMADFYAACDVLVLPSDTECLGLVQVEAMLCGTPVVNTDIPGAREAVRVTGMGCTVPPGDPEALGRAVVDVVANREKYVKPRAEIEQAYNFQETIDRYERVFREAAARGR
ncbi:MAG: glycosyltransferase family 4 protein [Anaerolineae bacterium]